MDCYELDKGKIKSVQFEKIGKNKLTWIRAISPSEEDLKKIVEISNVPLEELRETVEEEERPRLSKKKYIELIYDLPHQFRNEGLQTMEVYFYLSGNLLITIEEEKTRVFNQIEEKCINNKGKFFFTSQGAFLFHALDSINDVFITRIERSSRVLNAKKEATINTTELYATSMMFAYFNQAIIANLEVLNQLKKCHHKAFDAEDRHNFNELYIDMLQILDTEKIQRELVMNMIDLQTILSTQTLNKTMKRLTAFALIFMVPTFITSLYGMNISLPLSNHPHAFFILGAAMVGITVLLLGMFKFFDWV